MYQRSIFFPQLTALRQHLGRWSERGRGGKGRGGGGAPLHERVPLPFCI